MNESKEAVTKIVSGVLLMLILVLSFGLQDAAAQGRQEYPKIEDEEWLSVKNYNCPECEMIFQGTDFTIWEYENGSRVVVIGEITDFSTFQNEGFAYNYCFRGVQHAIPGQCDSPKYEQYRIE